MNADLFCYDKVSGFVPLLSPSTGGVWGGPDKALNKVK